MTEQLRFNTGKPALSYALASVAVWEEVANEDCERGTVEDIAQTIWCGLSSFVQDCETEARELENDEILVVRTPWEALIPGNPENDENHGTLYTDLTPLEISERFTRACMKGAEKYPRGNYLLGTSVCKYLDSAARHLDRMMRGEQHDSESGLEHLDHVVWNVVRAHEMYLLATSNDPDARPELDDRPIVCMRRDLAARGTP